MRDRTGASGQDPDPDPVPNQPDAPRESDLEVLLRMVARGDEAAFEEIYNRESAVVFGLVRRILRDPGQSEEVAQEVFVEIWRSASGYDENKHSAQAWIAIVAHRRAIDRVRAEQAGKQRESKAATMDEPAYDSVVEEVQTRLDRERVRRCLQGLTDFQRQTVTLAYYSGYTYREVARLLSAPLGTIKTRMRDSLIRLHDCLGVD